MTLELPVFRLGMAGFSPQQEAELAVALRRNAAGAMVWEPGQMADCDALWVNGARAQWLSNDSVRVAPGNPTARYLHLYLPDVGRPVAFSTPVSCDGFQPAYSFDAASRDSMNAVLEKFEAWLSPLAAQFCLASHIVEHESALGSGMFDLRLNGNLLAVVNMPGNISVLPSAGPTDFDDATWSRTAPRTEIPENFARIDLSQLMWQYAVRTQRDVLPRHYRTGLLYYRRPPRLPQRLLMDSHLLVMRELAREPASFQALQQHCRLEPRQLARDLAALYFVGAITSNPKRAAVSQRPYRSEESDAAQVIHSIMPSALDSVLPADAARRALVPGDLTAPAPLRPKN